MRRGVVALLLVLGACAGSSEAGVDECFRDLAARYEQAVNALEDANLGASLAGMAKGTREILDAAADHDTAALKQAHEDWQEAADAAMAAGDTFATEVAVARELDVDCP